jgi:hypothetical protein
MKIGTLVRTPQGQLGIVLSRELPDIQVRHYTHIKTVTETWFREEELSQVEECDQLICDVLSYGRLQTDTATVILWLYKRIYGEE